MELKRLSDETIRLYGEHHGSAFYYNEESPNSFLDYMESLFGDKKDIYLTGFFDGLSGVLRRKYRYHKTDEKAC